MTRLGEGGGQKVGHAQPIRRRVVATTKRKSHTRGCMSDLLPKIFPSMGRSGRGDSKGGVAGRKQCL